MIDQSEVEKAEQLKDERELKRKYPLWVPVFFILLTAYLAYKYYHFIPEELKK